MNYVKSANRSKLPRDKSVSTEVSYLEMKVGQLKKVTLLWKWVNRRKLSWYESGSPEVSFLRWKWVKILSFYYKSPCTLKLFEYLYSYYKPVHSVTWVLIFLLHVPLYIKYLRLYESDTGKSVLTL